MRCGITAAVLAAVMGGTSLQARAQPEPGVRADQTEPAPLVVGDKAPPLRIAQWLKGEPVEQFTPGRVYAVEFWATWCGPCIAGIPHLSELQQRFKDHADFVSVTTDDPNNTLEIVTEFVETRGEQMEYRVAFDERDLTWAAYMEAAGQNGIPCAFIVDKQGRVAWVGHPGTPEFERTIEQIIADEFDLEAAIKASAERAAQAGRARAAQAELHEAWRAGDRDRAFALADEIVALDPVSMGQWAWWKFEALMLSEPARASAYARSLLAETYSESPDMLLRLTYGLADSLGIENPDLDLALELAQRCVALTDNQDARMLAGLAMVQMRRKAFDEAIAAQRRAVDIATTPAIKHQLQNDLEFYELEREYESGG